MITRKTRRGIILLVLLTVVSFWASRSQDLEETTPVTGLDPKLNYVLRDFELQFYDKQGHPTINMKAPVLRNNPDLELGTIEQPVVRLNQANEVWDITAETATVTADKEHVQLMGLVTVKRHELATGSRLQLDTSEVRIEVTPQTATTDQPVSISEGLSQVNAIGLDLDMGTSTFKLKQQVTATYVVK